VTPLWTPETLAAAILWGPLDARRFRKARRHLIEQAESLSVEAVLAAVDAQSDAATASRVRDGLAKVGVAP